MKDSQVPRSASRGAGEEDEDPYEDVDVSTLPDWWQRNIEEYREHGMRSYLPPRFSDGALLTPCIEEIESEHDVDVQIVMTNPEDDNEADIIVEGDTVCDVPRVRKPEGYTVYELTSDEFDRIVRTYVDSS